MDDEVFWINNIYILLKKDKLLNFIPDFNKYSLNVNLNRITRFMLYYLLILYIFDYISVGNMICGVVLSIVVILLLYNKKKIIENFEVNQDNIKRVPTKNNPVMNLSIMDYGTKDVPTADYENKNIDENLLGDNYNNIDKNDINSQNEANFVYRNFYTMPNTSNPNNQTEFAKWLYDKGPTCKQDTSVCPENLPDRLQVGRGGTALMLK